jgi:hypothetical protein
MSYTVYELRDSESGTIDQSNLESAETWSIQKRYVIGQCPDGFYEAVSGIAPYAPRYVNNPFGRYWRRKRLGIKGLGKAVFEVTADYETLTPISGADAKDDSSADNNFVPGAIAWDTTGGTEHRTQARGERIIGDATLDMQGAINVSGTSVQGIDVVVPTMRYSETWVMPLAIGLSPVYVGDVFALTGTVNKAQFRSFDAGEALFMGARAQWSGDQPYVAVTYDWQCRPNDDAYYLKGLDTTTKGGWEYVWIVYDSATSSNTLVQKPRAYVFNTLYKDGDFSLLRITQSKPGAGVTQTAAQAAAIASQVAGFFQR